MFVALGFVVSAPHGVGGEHHNLRSGKVLSYVNVLSK